MTAAERPADTAAGAPESQSVRALRFFTVPVFETGSDDSWMDAAGAPMEAAGLQAASGLSLDRAW